LHITSTGLSSSDQRIQSSEIQSAFADAMKVVMPLARLGTLGLLCGHPVVSVVGVDGYARERPQGPPSASPRQDTTYVLCEHSGLLAVNGRCIKHGGDGCLIVVGWIGRDWSDSR
jgi:hypothetical protein